MMMQKIPNMMQPIPFVTPPMVQAPLSISKQPQQQGQGGGILDQIMSLFGKGGKGGGGIDPMTILSLIGM